MGTEWMCWEPECWTYPQVASHPSSTSLQAVSKPGLARVKRIDIPECGRRQRACPTFETGFSVIVSSSLISIPDDSTMQWNVTSPLTTGWKTSIYSGTVRGTVKISETDNAAWTLLGSWEKSVEVTAAEGGGGGGGGDPPAGG